MEAKIIHGPEAINLQNELLTYYTNTKSSPKNIYYDLSPEYGLRTLKTTNDDFFLVTDLRLPFYINCREWLSQIQQNKIYIELKQLFSNIPKQTIQTQNLSLTVDGVCFRDINEHIKTANKKLEGLAELSVIFDNITKKGKYTTIQIIISDNSKIENIRQIITELLSDYQLHFSKNKPILNTNDNLISDTYIYINKIIKVINGFYKDVVNQKINLKRDLTYHYYLNQLAINNVQTILKNKSEIILPDYYQDINNNVSESMSSIRKEEGNNNPDLLSEALGHDLTLIEGFQINQMVYHDGKKAIITHINNDKITIRYIYTTETEIVNKDDISLILGIQNQLKNISKNINQDVFFPVKELSEFDLKDIYQKLQIIFPKHDLSNFKHLLQLSINEGVYLQDDRKLIFTNITQNDIEFRPYIIKYKIKQDKNILNNHLIINQCLSITDNPNFILPYHHKCEYISSKQNNESGILINFENITTEKLTPSIDSNDKLIITIKLQLSNDILIITNNNMRHDVGNELYESITSQYKLFLPWRYQLSNEYLCNLTLDGYIWESVDNYLENIFNILDIEKTIKVSECSTIRNYFITMGLDISKLSIFNNLTIYNLFLIRALSCKFNNRQFKTILLNTKQAQLVLKQIDNQYQICNSLMYIRFFLQNNIPLLYNNKVEIFTYEKNNFNNLIKKGIKTITIMLKNIPLLQDIKERDHIIFTHELDIDSQILFNTMCQELLKNTEFIKELQLLLLTQKQEEILQSDLQLIPPIITNINRDIILNEKNILQKLLKQRDLILYDSPSDGDCLFYSILQQLTYHNYYDIITNLNNKFNNNRASCTVNTTTKEGKEHTLNCMVLSESMLTLRNEVSNLLKNNADISIKGESPTSKHGDVSIKHLVFYNFLEHFPTKEDDDSKTDEYFKGYITALAKSAAMDNINKEEKLGIWGDDLIIRLLSALFNIDITVYQYIKDTKILNTLEFKANDNRLLFTTLPDWAIGLEYLGHINIAYVNKIHYTSVLNISDCLLFYYNTDMKIKQIDGTSNVLVGEQFNIEHGTFNYLSSYIQSLILPNEIEIIYYTNKESQEIIYYGKKIGRLQDKIIIWN